MRRRIVGIVIIAFWVAMTAWLLRREVFLPRHDAPQNIALTEPRDRWFGLFLGGATLAERTEVGRLHLRQEPAIEDGAEGTRLALDTTVVLNLLGQPTDLELDGWVWRPSTGEGGPLRLLSSLGWLRFSGARRASRRGPSRRGQVRGRNPSARVADRR